MQSNIYIYILIMACVTYIIRALPLTLIKGEIKSTFIKSFLYYVPYVTLAAMVFPSIIFSTESKISALVGFIISVVLSYFERSLITVACCACIGVFLTELVIL